jgi:hypothetical protein
MAKTKLTPEKQQIIVRALEAGNYDEVAARHGSLGEKHPEPAEAVYPYSYGHFPLLSLACHVLLIVTKNPGDSPTRTRGPHAHHRECDGGARGAKVAPLVPTAGVIDQAGQLGAVGAPRLRGGAAGELASHL